jgi:hypothetical protein
MQQTDQLDFCLDHAPSASAALTNRRSGTFIDNMKLPIHGWFRYSAGFSADWVTDVVKRRCTSGRQLKVLDPFAGSGTAVLAAATGGAKSFGFETHPFVYRIARAKQGWDVDTHALREAAMQVLAVAQKGRSSSPESIAPLLAKCYTERTLSDLDALRDAYLSERTEHAHWELVWLALTAILRECSGVGTAQWQYVLPNKRKAKHADPFTAFSVRINRFIRDIESARKLEWVSGTMLPIDARSPDCDERSFDLVVTSPPYPNNYDYADATRLEMTFWREIAGWGDLQSAVRRHLIRSCSQHSAAEKLELEDLLDDPSIAPIRGELASACHQLAELRMTKGGKKTYHTMVAAYFADLAKVWIDLFDRCTDTAEICYVVGDSAPYGVHVPVERWLGELALSVGFRSFEFEKLRDRNIKWKNRKHRVPLHEGRLWVRR